MQAAKLFDLSGRKALITGSSRGLGLQIATALGANGAELVLSARNTDELDQAVATLSEQGIRAHAVAADVGSADGVERLAEQAVDTLGHIDILVNNAGAAWGAPAEDHPLDAWQKLVDLNLTGLFLLCQQAAKRSMIPRGYGRILNVASIAGLRGNPLGQMQTIAYNTTKGGVVNFTRTLAGEWGRYGITVNALAPGFFPSKMTRGTLDAYGEEIASQVPLKKIGNDTDLYGAALLFCSDAGGHISGQILAVDGGASAV